MRLLDSEPVGGGPPVVRASGIHGVIFADSLDRARYGKTTMTISVPIPCTAYWNLRAVWWGLIDIADKAAEDKRGSPGRNR